MSWCGPGVGSGRSERMSLQVAAVDPVGHGDRRGAGGSRRGHLDGATSGTMAELSQGQVE